MTQAPNNAAAAGQFYAKLSRPQNALYSGALAVCVYAALGGRSVGTALLLYGMLFCMYATAAAINNLHDKSSDKINHRHDNPLLRTAISVKHVYIFAGLAAAASAVCAMALGWPAVLIWCAYVILLGAYSMPPIQLKARSLLGIIALALCYSGLPVLLGAAQTSMLDSAVLAALLMTCLSVPGLLAKDYKDEEGDRKAHVRTPLIRYGADRVQRIAIGFVTSTGLLVLWAQPTLFVGACVALVATLVVMLHRNRAANALTLRAAQLVLIVIATQLVNAT